MKNKIAIAILVFFLIVASGFIRTEHTTTKQDCAFSFAVNHQVCKTVPVSYIEPGWLERPLRGIIR